MFTSHDWNITSNNYADTNSATPTANPGPDSLPSKNVSPLGSSPVTEIALRWVGCGPSELNVVAGVPNSKVGKWECVDVTRMSRLSTVQGDDDCGQSSTVRCEVASPISIRNRVTRMDDSGDMKTIKFKNDDSALVISPTSSKMFRNDSATKYKVPSLSNTVPSVTYLFNQVLREEDGIALYK